MNRIKLPRPPGIEDEKKSLALLVTYQLTKWVIPIKARASRRTLKDHQGEYRTHLIQYLEEEKFNPKVIMLILEGKSYDSIAEIIVKEGLDTKIE